jgi:uncharacterized protein
MNKDRVISKTEEFIKEILTEYDSGHDWWHIERVRKLAMYINDHEAIADPFTLEIAALMHDSVDSKFLKGDPEAGYNMIGQFMDKNGLSDIKDHIIGVVRNVSFSSKNRTANLSDPVLLIIQDADKLDAIGAIGIARAFNYGGFRNNPIYIPAEESLSAIPSTIGHFYDKLLRLKGMMNTSTGLKLAEKRHQYLEKFLEQFYSEWEFGTGIKP